MKKEKASETKHFHALLDGISYRCRQDPKGRAFVFLDENEHALAVSNEQFYNDIQRYASGFIAKQIKPGEIVLLALDHGYELLCCFWGAICGGAIPSVLTYWRLGSDVDVYARKMKNLAEATCARVVVTLPELYPATSTALERIKCHVFRADEIADGSPDINSALPELRSEQIALMQFTSGTTSEPKAIQFTHRAVLDHVEASAHAYQIARDCVYVSWLPFYHDMGLIGHIRALIYGGLLVSMAPQTWLRQPEMFLKAIHRYRGTMSNMPNFGFDYCAQRIREEDITGIDLSSWQILSNGSEPVMLSSMQRFHERFSKYGFRPEALAVGYGMAENVMGVSVTPPGQVLRTDWVLVDDLQKKNCAIPVEQGSPGARAVPSCGYPYRGIELAIVDEHWLKLAEREVGEIVIRSNTLFEGYYLAPKDTEGSFRKGWFRTGDIGYFADGQLYVCGRKKDLIIVGGRNVQPQAIENIAASVFGPLAGRCAAFGVASPHLGTELPVLVIEQRKQLGDDEKHNLISQVRKQVLDELDVAISDVRLVPKGWVMKTTSGKIARAANKKKYLDEGVNNNFEEPRISPDELTPEQVKHDLISLFEKVLGISGVGEQDNFFLLCGDSLSALRLLLEIERQFGREISAADFFQRPTIENVVEILRHSEQADINLHTETRALPLIRQPLGKKIKSLILFRYGLKWVRLKIAEIIPAWAYEQKWAKHILNAKRIRLMKQFYKSINVPLQGESEFIQCGLTCHVPYSMRKKTNQQLFSRWLAKWSLHLDLATLESACQSGKGVIMVCWHSHRWINGLVQKNILERVKPVDYILIGSLHRFLQKHVKFLPAEEKRRVRSMKLLDLLMKGERILKRGGVVSILPDGYGGMSRGISLRFHGGIRSFRAGFAELTIETGAAVIPISLSMDISQRLLIISSLKPLEAGRSEMPREERVEELVKQYVAFLSQEWSRSPALVSTGRMHKHINLPLI
jgi:acyl-CoA synthetase (AMP-forming)/AMP-acid ligase II/acyl carrier protein